MEELGGKFQPAELLDHISGYKMSRLFWRKVKLLFPACHYSIQGDDYIIHTSPEV